jgi:hypothetical protein
MRLLKPENYGEQWHADAVFQVLNSRLEKTRILNSKLAAALLRLEGSGKSMQDAIGPLAVNTKHLRTLDTSMDPFGFQGPLLTTGRH